MMLLNLNGFISRDGSIFKTYVSISKNILVNKSFNLYTYSREAIYDIFKQNKISSTDEIILPKYLCSTVIESILPFTDNIKFYDISENMTFNCSDIKLLISDKTKLIFFVDYFGVETNVDKELESFLKKKDIIIVKDSAHSFLSLVNNKFTKKYEFDYLISSVYKNLPLQVGAIAIGEFEVKCNFVNFSVFIKRNIVRILKNIFSLFGQHQYINRNMDKLIVSNDKHIDYSYGINIGKLYSLLLKHINYKKIILEKQKLAKEYNMFFSNNLIYKSLFPLISIENNVLQSYPIICDNKEQRDYLLNLLKEESIDAYTWPTFHKINAYDTLWNKILLLPLDKRVLIILNRSIDV